MSSSIVDKMLSYRDNWGLITQKDKDGGDALLRFATYYSLLKVLGVIFDDQYMGVNEAFDQQVKRFEYHDYGMYVRHPNPATWCSNPLNTSRDQLVGVTMALVFFNNQEAINRIKMACKERWWLNQNVYDNYITVTPNTKKKFPDLPTPYQFSLFIRAKANLNIWDKARLLFLDSFLLLDNWLATRNGWDMYNLIVLQHYLAYTKHRTIFSKLAWEKMLDREAAKTQITRYYRETDGMNGIEPLGELYNMLLEKK